MKWNIIILFLLPLLVLSCSTIPKKTEEIKTQPTVPVEEWLNTEQGLVQVGIASWYGDDFHGKRTANGEIYDMDKLTAAHKYLPFHTLVEVENLVNNKKVLVRINDRGPFVGGRIIDLSRKAARQIGMEDPGTARVRLRIVKASEIGKAPPNEPAETDKETGIEKEDITVTEVKETNIPETVTFPPPPESPPVVQNHLSEGYYLQAGAFGSMKNAKRLLRRIKQILPEVSFEIQFKEGLYKIISDKLGSRETAEQLKNRLDENDIETFIRSE